MYFKLTCVWNDACNICVPLADTNIDTNINTRAIAVFAVVTGWYDRHCNRREQSSIHIYIYIIRLSTDLAAHVAVGFTGVNFWSCADVSCVQKYMQPQK